MEVEAFLTSRILYIYMPLPSDAPRLDDSDCPRSWTWPEGPEQTLRCDARGNPQPSVHCVRPDGGAVLALGLLGPVTRALAGTYRCIATNDQGQAVKDETFTVECQWGSTGHSVSFSGPRGGLTTEEGGNRV